MSEPTPEELGLELYDRAPASAPTAQPAPQGKEPSPESLGLELYATAGQAQAHEPDPKALGLELYPSDPDPASLGLETYPPQDTSRGIVGQAFDSVKHGLGAVGSAIADEWHNGSIGDMARSFADSTSGKTFLHGAGEVFNASNRIGGSTFAGASELIQQAFLMDGDHMIDNARKAQAEEAQSRGETVSLFDQAFPVRLVEDLGMPLGTKPLQYVGKSLQGSDSKTVREVGEVISGLAPAAGIATGVLTAAFLDPLAITKFGSLTEAGIELDKTGELASGIAKQISEGQRSILELRTGGILGVPETSLARTNFGKVGVNAVAKAADVMATAESAVLPKWVPFVGGTSPARGIRSMMTFTPLEEVNQAVSRYHSELTGVDYSTRQYLNGAYQKAMTLGIDVDNPNVLDELYRGFSQPSKYAGSIPKEDVESFYQYLNGELQKQVELNRAFNIPVPEKQFGGFSEAELFEHRLQSKNAITVLERELENPELSETAQRNIQLEINRHQELLHSPVAVQDFDERYVPRDATPTKRQMYVAAKNIKDAEDAANLVNQVAGIKVSSGTARYDAFQKLRDLRSREAMNREIFQRTGVSEFFHNDPVQAFADKVAQLQTARAQKRFVGQMVSQFAVDDAGYMKLLNDSAERVRQAQALGVVPDGKDLLLSKIPRTIARDVTAEEIAMIKRLPDDVKEGLRLSEISPKAGSASKTRGILRIDDPSIVERLPESLQRGYTADGLKPYAQLPENVRNKLHSLAGLSSELEGAGTLKLPSFVADRVAEVLSAPTQNTIVNNLLSFQNSLKGFMFFNPGFHLRNFYENFARGLMVDTGVADQAKALMALSTGKTNWAERLPLYLERVKVMGVASPADITLDMASQGKYLEEKIKVAKSVIESQGRQNALTSTLSGIKEMAATGKLEGFLKDLRATASQMPENIKEGGWFGPKSPIRNNPLFRFSTAANEHGEMVPRFAYFNKLLDQGYEADQAVYKMSQAFPDWSDVRSGTRMASTVVPFANYMVKNAETALSLLAQNPRVGVIAGPGGAFQRAVEKWSGFDPERTWKYKEQFGVYAHEWTLLPVLPGHEDMMAEPDLVKKFMYNLFSMGRPDAEGKPVNDLEGAQLWMRLPTNVHALSMLDPRQLNEMMGPVVRMGMALVGIDPFTGNKIAGAGTSMEGTEKMNAISKLLMQPVVPMRALRQAQGFISQVWPDYEKNLVNFGMDPKTVELLLGDKTDQTRREIAKYTAQAKAMWMGGATQLGVDQILRGNAILNQSKKYMGQVLKQAALGRRPEKDIESAQKAVLGQVKKLTEIMDIRAEYEGVLRKLKAPVDPELQIINDGPESDATENNDAGVTSAYPGGDSQ